MQSADADHRPPEPAIPGQGLAVTAEALYLLNLLALPGLAFLLLVAVYYHQGHHCPPLAACHLRQTLSASLWAAFLLLVANALIIWLGGYRVAMTWVIVILYFTFCHSCLVLFGMVGLAKALAGRHYHYPLVGRPCDEK